MKINKLKTQINKLKGIKEKLDQKVVMAMVVGTTLAVNMSTPAQAVDVLQIDGVDNVATSLQNIVKDVGLLFLAGGAITAFYGAYKLTQSIKSQDSESRSTAILELGAGLLAASVGGSAAYFSAYIKLG